MRSRAKTESVLEVLARALGASAGIAVQTGSEVANEIAATAKRIRAKLAEGADRVKRVADDRPARSRAPRSRAGAAPPRSKRSAKSAAKK